VRLKDYASAVNDFKRALELDPNQFDALNDLARVYLGTRRELPEALALSRRCVTLQPTAANYELLAETSYLNGQVNEARAASTQAVRMDPTNAVYLEHDRRFNRKL
jgi:tetratricopeptide (TPR) repeat protein